MPAAYVKKLAKKHHVSVKKAEKKWKEAKEKTGKGKGWGYTTSIFKNLMHENNGAKVTFKQFLNELDHYDDDEHDHEEEQGPEHEDYVITPSGPLYSKVSVSIVGGKFVGEFPNEEAAEKEIRKRMEQEKFWPNVWWVSDHGNVSPYNMSFDKKD